MGLMSLVVGRADVPISDVDPDQARRTADQVLSGRAYLEAAKPPSLQERFFAWLQDILAEVFGALSSVGGRGVIAWVMTGLFALVIIWLVARLVRNLGPTPLREARREASIFVDQDLSVAQWMAEAERAEAAGQWREGLRCRHRALVTELIEREAISAAPGQTAGEIEFNVAVHVPAAEEPMRAATGLFKDVWYGGASAGPEERDRFQKMADTVLAALAMPGAGSSGPVLVAPS